jgi:hypothetical protein
MPASLQRQLPPSLLPPALPSRAAFASTLALLLGVGQAAAPGQETRRVRAVDWARQQAAVDWAVQRAAAAEHLRTQVEAV